ncbi:Trans-aconitate 2-methyltransferase [Escovopsis weberi]|uniref:Trans-aconitate 2-methyltransferase n=1 Tax=Escovopsis weberi TaxID=150374 RepID=A0A0M8MRI2_ESCWE|nr:Trans-aconitate 2-methyltransferase [Escovopsis weberi]
MEANRYGLPNDELEQNREALKQRLYSDYVLEGRHFMAPIDRFPQKIVDLGCGAGFWTLDVAEEYPSARVIGCDISPIQPRWLPNNLEFHIEDLDDELSPWSAVYQEADLIFVRAYENLKPGGWIECHDIVLPVTWEDGKPAPDHPFSKLYDRMRLGSFAKVYGWEIYLPNRMPSALRDAGFINVSEKHTQVPIGNWHRDKRMREMGLLNHCVLGDWIPAVMNKEKAWGMNEEDADAIAADVLNAFDNPNYHARSDWASFWAQKPY